MREETLLWYTEGQSVIFDSPEFGGELRLDCGLFYACDSENSPLKLPEPSAIDFALPIADTIDLSSADPGSSPTYEGLTENQRRCYLEWLAAGRRGHTFEQSFLGYVHLALCGFERRLLLERDLDASLVSEAWELLNHYGNTTGTSTVSSQLAQFIHFSAWKLGPQTYRSFWPAFVQRDKHQLQEKDLRLILSNLHDLGEPIDWTVAFALARQMLETETQGRTPGVSSHSPVHIQPEFEQLFRQRYLQAYATGFPIPSTTLTSIHYYQPASTVLQELNKKPGYTGLFLFRHSNVYDRRSQFKELTELWKSCVEDIKSNQPQTFSPSPPKIRISLTNKTVESSAVTGE